MRQWFGKKESQLSIGLFVWFSLWVNAEYLRSLNNLFESLKHGLLKKVKATKHKHTSSLAFIILSSSSLDNSAVPYNG